MSSFAQDFRYALRQLWRSPGFAVTCLLSLACGIAATTAVFSVVWAVVVNPYPYAASDRMAHLALGDPTGTGYENFGTTATQWQQIRAVPAIEDSILTSGKNVALTGGELPQNVRAGNMTSNAFQFFGVPALLGRGLLPSDAVGGEDPQPVAVLSHAFWRKQFNGDPGVLGKTVELDKKPYTVVGVAAPRFTWLDADIYLPMKLTAGIENAGTLEVRLRPGVSRRIAEQQLNPLITQFEKDTPVFFDPKPGPLRVIGLNEQFMKAIGPTLAMLFGAVLLLLAIGCANVSILLLARGAGRQHEFAVRSAIGASRARIVRQLLTEAVLLSFTGAALGVVLSYKLVNLIVTLLPEFSFPHEAQIRINLPVLLFCVVVALLTGILFGMSPAVRLSRPDVRDAMQSGSRTVVGGSRERLVHNGLIAGQIALTLLMLTTATVAIQSFLKLAHIPLGYDPQNTMSVGLSFPAEKYPTAQAREAYIEQLREKVATTPGVQGVAVSSNATPPDNGFNLPVEILGQPTAQDQSLLLNLVGPEYFPLLRIPLLQGRIWSASENHNAAKLCVVNQAFAKKFFPNGDILGHSLRSSALGKPFPGVVVADGVAGWLQIVGVVGDKLDSGLGKPVVPEIFVPYPLLIGRGTQLLVRTQGPPLDMLHTIGLRVAQVNGDQQIGSNVRDLEHWITTQTEYAQGNFVSLLFGSFATLALLLAAVGLYSVMSYTVAQRTSEFGIRMALGAMRANVLQLVLRSSAVAVGSGILVGAVLALALHQVVSHIVIAASSNSGWPFLLSLLILSAVSLAASLVPAFRASRVDPIEALRYE